MCYGLACCQPNLTMSESVAAGGVARGSKTGKIIKQFYGRNLGVPD